MTASFGISFGNTNAVVVAYQASGASVSVEVSPFTSSQQSVFLIPSVVHYTATGDFPLIGAEVDDVKFLDRDRTIVSFKRYFGYTHGHEINGKIVSFSDAAKDFFAKLLRQCRERNVVPMTASLGITLPIADFDESVTWLKAVCSSEGFTNIRFIDESSAALLSFGLRVADGDLVLICDLGATTIELTLVQFKLDPENLKKGKHAALLGHSRLEVGGNSIDDWLQSSFKNQTKISIDQLQERRLLALCRTAKEELSESAAASIQFEGGEVEFEQTDLNSMLDKHGIVEKLEKALERLIDTVFHDFGFEEHHLKHVISIGGTSRIPIIRKFFRDRFSDRLRCDDRPVDALARGAAAFAAGRDVFSHVHHDYALCFLDLDTNANRFEIIVPRGSQYPSKNILSTRTVTATSYNQSSFELVICELQSFEDAEGKLDYKIRYLNKDAPFLIHSDRPVQKGCEAFKIDFLLDEEKHLLVNTYHFNFRGAVEPALVQRPIIKLV